MRDCDGIQSFVVSDECQQLGLRAGAVILRNVRVAHGDPDLRSEIVREAQSVQQRLAQAGAVRSLPEVGRFHEILRKVGVNPRRDQPSIERLLGVALKRGDLPAINTLVDAYNLASLRSCCSLGAHDLDRIALPVALRLFTGQETFTPLGQDAELPVVAGEYGYVDGQDRVLCRLDVVQADFSKVTVDTVNALLIIEATAAHPPAAVQQAFADSIMMMTRYCGGTAEIVALPESAE
jgi:DNA/RNA-binding domain of Phe-tRNA-synthetase-like protein